MKKIYLLFAGLSIAGSINAQQLTQANHAATVGDSYQMYQCDSVGVSSGTAGAAALWNFSSITTHSNVLKSYTAAAVSNISYPNASVSVGSGSANTSYYNSDATSLKYYGGNITVGTIGVALVYTNAAIQATYPMGLGTTTNNSIGGSLTALGFPGTFSGNSSVSADGTGTLILPGTNATFTSAIRVVTTQTINFTTTIATGTVTQMNYDYFVTGIKAPAFSISSSTLVTSLSAPSTQTLVFRNKNAVLSATTTVGLKDQKANDSQIAVYPNPCNQILNFKLASNTNVKLQVLDLTGKTIELTEVSSDKLSINTSNYNNGLYFYKIQNTDGETMQSGKFTVSH